MENMHTDVRVSRVDVRHEKMCSGSFLILGRSIIPFLVSLRGILENSFFWYQNVGVKTKQCLYSNKTNKRHSTHMCILHIHLAPWVGFQKQWTQ